MKHSLPVSPVFTSLMFAFSLTLLFAPQTVAQTSRQVFIDSLHKNFRIEPCCASPIAACVKQKPNCSLAPRLTEFINWMDSVAQTNPNVTNEKMLEALKERYASFTNNKKYAVDAKGWPVVGDPKSPIVVTMYYSTTCPVCKANFKELYPIVTSGVLKGKVKIVAKPFGINIGNQALVAAHDVGRFADFMLALARVEGRVEEEIIYKIADDLYLDRNIFKTMMESSEVQKRVEQSKKEGDNNGVTHVPSFFISGRRYNSFIDPKWIIDAIDFTYETDVLKK